MATARAAVLGLVLLTLVPLASVEACRSGPSELTPSSPRASDAGATASSDPHPREAHRIIEQDHRHIIRLHVDDRVVLPNDPTFDWRVDFEDPSAFERVRARVTDADADTYRVTKAGPFRMMVYGDPKCLESTPPCGLSKRRWDVTVTVQ